MIMNDIYGSVAVCAVCSSRHPRAMSPTQGPGCAALVVRRDRDGVVGILGQYGSDFDLVFFPFLRGQLPVGTDPVCDSCIRALVGRGQVVDFEAAEDWHDVWSLS
jgi:hypothetical protein